MGKRLTEAPANSISIKKMDCLAVRWLFVWCYLCRLIGCCCKLLCQYTSVAAQKKVHSTFFQNTINDNEVRNFLQHKKCAHSVAMCRSAGERCLRLLAAKMLSKTILAILIFCFCKHRVLGLNNKESGDKNVFSGNNQGPLLQTCIMVCVNNCIVHPIVLCKCI